MAACLAAAVGIRSPGRPARRGDVPQRQLARVLSAWVMHFVTERKGLLWLCQVSSCSVTSIDQLQHVQFRGK